MKIDIAKNGHVRCLVHGCRNHRDEGNFVGDLCAPCHKSLTTGKISHTTSFLGPLARDAAEGAEWREAHDRVLRIYQHRLVELATAAVTATAYPEPPTPP